MRVLYFLHCGVLLSVKQEIVIKIVDVRLVDS